MQFTVGVQPNSDTYSKFLFTDKSVAVLRSHTFSSVCGAVLDMFSDADISRELDELELIFRAIHASDTQQVGLSHNGVNSHLIGSAHVQVTSGLALLLTTLGRPVVYLDTSEWRKALCADVCFYSDGINLRRLAGKLIRGADGRVNLTDFIRACEDSKSQPRTEIITGTPRSFAGVEVQSLDGIDIHSHLEFNFILANTLQAKSKCAVCGVTPQGIFIERSPACINVQTQLLAYIVTSTHRLERFSVSSGS
jgi:hypothetical protein